MSFRLTYATMFNPPEELHERFERALTKVRGRLGATHAMFIDGKDVPAAQTEERASPIDSQLKIGRFPLANAQEVESALAAAHRAFPDWRATSVAERVRLMRKVATVMEERVYEIAAALTLEVGKNRLEALGEAQECVDFFNVYADDFEAHKGYEFELPNDPSTAFTARNRSVMRPYGVWAVIAPFNFPIALAAGPTAAALVTGNTVVLKCASDTPWAGRLLADCIRDAGLPAGVFNFVNGAGAAVGEQLIRDARTAGATFTGSVGVGRTIMAEMAAGRYSRPYIAEMGGKNPTIVTEKADLDRAAAGIARSAYGMGGQKCSALSRLYVHEKVADALLAKIETEIDKIRIGDPTERETGLGPVVNKRAHENYARYVADLKSAGAKLRRGGGRPSEGAFARGYYVEPVLAEAPPSHPLWKHEMFLPILMVQRYRDREEAMRLANDTDMGLTAGFYGAPDEVPWFQDGIEAGVTYANRGAGATTGAWPGYQPFGGWKGSGSSGKAIASAYYLPLYLREQSRTVVE
jgi:acyl-CoA reductase-like NAD-dependent aldehyde dehydrogenase